MPSVLVLMQLRKLSLSHTSYSLTRPHIYCLLRQCSSVHLFTPPLLQVKEATSLNK